MVLDAEGPRRDCRRIVYRGRVQGVGFRYTTRGIAARFDVSGYVKNLRDGTVEVVVQGVPEVVDAFLGEMAMTFRQHIADAQIENYSTAESFQGFSICY